MDVSSTTNSTLSSTNDSYSGHYTSSTANSSHSVARLLQSRARPSSRFATSSPPSLPRLSPSSPTPCSLTSSPSSLFSPFEHFTLSSISMSSSGPKRSTAAVASTPGLPDYRYVSRHGNITYTRPSAQTPHSLPTNNPSYSDLYAIPSSCSSLPTTPPLPIPSLPIDATPPALCRKRSIPLPPVPDDLTHNTQHYSRSQNPSSPTCGSPTSLYSRKTSIYAPSPRKLRVVTAFDIGHEGLHQCSLSTSATPKRSRRPLTPSSPGTDKPLLSSSPGMTDNYEDPLEITDTDNDDVDDKRLSYRGPRVRRCTHAPWEEDWGATESLSHNEKESINVSVTNSTFKSTGALGLSGLTKHANRLVRAATRLPITQQRVTQVAGGGNVTHLTSSPSVRSTRTTASVSSSLTVSTTTSNGVVSAASIAYPMAPSMLCTTPARAIPPFSSAASSFLSSVSSSSEATPITPRLDYTNKLSQQFNGAGLHRPPASPSPEPETRPTFRTPRRPITADLSKLMPATNTNVLQLSGLNILSDSPRSAALAAMFPSDLQPGTTDGFMSSTGASPAFNLISLESAQERERSRATVRATASARAKTLAHSPSNQVRKSIATTPSAGLNRKRGVSLSTTSRPNTAHEEVSRSSPQQGVHRLKTKKSGFRLFSGGNKDRSSPVTLTATPGSVPSEPLPPMPFPFERVDGDVSERYTTAIKTMKAPNLPDAQFQNETDEKLLNVSRPSTTSMDIDVTSNHPPELALRPISISFAKALPQDYLSTMSPPTPLKRENVDLLPSAVSSVSSSAATITSLVLGVSGKFNGSATPTSSLAPPVELGATDRVIAELRAQNRELQDQLATAIRRVGGESSNVGSTVNGRDGRCATCGCSCGEKHQQQGGGGSVMDRSRVKTSGGGKVFGSGSLYEWQ